MRVSVGYEPIDVHVPFHKSPEYERHMFGAFGSGKTYAVCAEAIAFGLEQPGARILVTRKTIPELRDTTETVFFDVLPDALFHAGTTTRQGGHYSDYTMPNGTKFLFRSIDDWKKHKSMNLAAIAWDEMDEFDEETYLGMKSRIRQVEPTKEGRQRGAGKITRRATWGASNPAGHNWLWKYFVRNEKGAYFKSTSFDNPWLTPDYYDVLLSYPVPWIKRYVLCQFDDFAGQIYENWGDHRIVPNYPRNPFTGAPDYPEGSAVWMGMDPGTRNPTGGLWVVVEKQPGKAVRMVATAEYLESDLAASVHAKAWRKIEARHQFRVARRIADPNSVNVRDRGSNNRLSDIYRRLGFRFELGPSRFEDRIPALGTLIENGQFVVTEDCMQAFEAIRDAAWKDLTPAQRERGEDAPEEPLKKERELVDCAEYLAGRWAPGTPAVAEPIDENDWSFEIRQTIMAKVHGAGRRAPQAVEGIPV